MEKEEEEQEKYLFESNIDQINQMTQTSLKRSHGVRRNTNMPKRNKATLVKVHNMNVGVYTYITGGGVCKRSHKVLTGAKH